jgi:hypothetical protein
MGKPERKRPLGRPRHRRMDSIKMVLEEVERVVQIGLVRLRIGTSVGSSECGKEPWGSMKN